MGPESRILLIEDRFMRVISTDMPWIQADCTETHKTLQQISLRFAVRGLGVQKNTDTFKTTHTISGPLKFWGLADTILVDGERIGRPN